MVLLFLALASTIVISMASRASLQIRFVRMEQDRLRARVACISGYQWALNRLISGTTSPAELLERGGAGMTPRIFLDGTSVPLDLSRWGVDQRISASFQDGSGLINILAVPPHLLRSWLRRAAGIPSRQAAAAVDLMLDWMDRDDLRRLSGGESDHYRSRRMQPPGNRLFGNAEELGVIPEFSPALLGVMRKCAVFSVTSRGMNPNTSPEGAFEVFPGLSRDKVELIMKRRREIPFRTIDELVRVTGYDFRPHKDWLEFFTSRSVYVTISTVLSEKRVYYIAVRIDRGRTVRGVREMRSSWQKMLPPDMPREVHVHRWTEGSVAKSNE